MIAASPIDGFRSSTVMRHDLGSDMAGAWGRSRLRVCRMIFSYQYLAILVIVNGFFEVPLGWAGQYQ